MKELHAIFKGHVQGVGFRWTISNAAEKNRLVGCVKNLDDGSVEVYAVGSKEKLEAFLEVVKSNPGMAQIESVTARYQEPKNSYPDFRITFK